MNFAVKIDNMYDCVFCKRMKQSGHLHFAGALSASPLRDAFYIAYISQTVFGAETGWCYHLFVLISSLVGEGHREKK